MTVRFFTGEAHPGSLGEPRTELRPAWAVVFWWFTLTSLILRLSFFDFEGVDYRDHLSRWYDFFVEHGRWTGLGKMTLETANYPPLYLYLISVSTLLPLPKLYAIKLCSLLGDYAAAWLIWRLGIQLGFGKGRATMAAVLGFLFLPTVVMNSTVWGQCDVLYTGAFLASLLFLLRGREAAALVAFGVAASLKSQAVFWCPLLLGLSAAGRLKWSLLWIPAGVYSAAGLPAILAGRPALEVLGHYALIKNIPGLTLHAPNWYQWAGVKESLGLSLAGYFLTGVAILLLVLWMNKALRPGDSTTFARGEIPSGSTRRIAISDATLVRAAMLSVMLPPFLLPGMHERYFYAADVMAIVYALAFRRGWIVVLLMQFASGFAYCPFLFRKEPVPEYLLPVAVVVALELVILDALRDGLARCAQVPSTDPNNPSASAQIPNSEPLASSGTTVS